MNLAKTIAFSAIVGLGCLIGVAQTTQPGSATLEYRANQAFTQGRYAAALPMLQELAGTLIDQTDKLGPVEERIRVCQKAIAAAKKMGPDAAVFQPATVPSLSANRVPHPKPLPNQEVELAIKQLGNFDYDAENGGTIPKDVINLSGCKLKTYGYMIPLDQAESIQRFALVPSLFSCCFGQPPQVQHTIVVTLPPGKAIDYFPDEMQVEGTLHVEEKRDEGYIVSVFDMDAISITPAAK